MKEGIQDNYISRNSNIITGDDLLNCIKGMPALLFRIEIEKNRIEYLNDYQVEGLKELTFSLIKNKAYAKEIILEEDYHLYESFIQATHKAQPSRIIFRIHTESGELRWISLKGSHNSYNSGFYMGVLMDITPSVQIISGMLEKENEDLAMINMLDNPVVLIDMASKTIISHNKAAQEVFGYSFNEFNSLSITDLYHPSMAGEVSMVLEEVMFDKKWEGKFFFRRKGQARFLCDTSMRSFKINEKILLRISVHAVDIYKDEIDQTEHKFSDKKKKIPALVYQQSLIEKISSLSEMKDILDVFINNPYPGKAPLDGIMYSDILPSKDKVFVYASGKPFENLPFGEMFTYDGTIAENIEQYKLNYLLIDDTMSSIKAIDWALFIPNGIRSYYAKPFYERNTLRTVLILCSTETNAFTEENIEQYDLLAEPFIKGVKNWRKMLRQKKS